MGSGNAAVAAPDDDNDNEGKWLAYQPKEVTAALRSGEAGNEDDLTATAHEYLRDVLGMSAEVSYDDVVHIMGRGVVSSVSLCEQLRPLKRRLPRGRRIVPIKGVADDPSLPSFSAKGRKRFFWRRGS